jgi:hypothetical protein
LVTQTQEGKLNAGEAAKVENYLSRHSSAGTAAIESPTVAQANKTVVTRCEQSFRGERCQMPAAFYWSSFQIDHIVARQHGGKTKTWLSLVSIAAPTRVRILPASIRTPNCSRGFSTLDRIGGKTIFDGLAPSWLESPV